MSTADDLRREIWELLKTADEANVFAAAELTPSLPPSRARLPTSLTAQCISRRRLRRIVFGKDNLAIELYRRVLPYPVIDTKSQASAWFRIGVCAGRQGRLAEAMSCYREKRSVSRRDLPHMTTLAHFYPGRVEASFGRPS